MKKIITIFCLVCIKSIVWSQEISFQEADSLFVQKKYTEALSIYENVLSSGYYNDAMLLKMAYIQEGLDSYPKALYYLNLYYIYSADRNTWVKLKSLAEKYELIGYEDKKVDLIYVVVNKYSQKITLILVIISFIFILYVFSKWRRGERSIITISLLIIVIVTVTLVNNMQRTREGIVWGDNILLRSGPSAGAETVSRINPGHKVKVLEKSEAWSKIIWEGKTVYIRNTRLLLI